MSELNHRVTIEQQQAGQDSIGQPLTGWDVVAEVWANVRHLAGSEAIKADATAGSVRASVRIRHRAGIDSGMRLTHQGRQYDIKAVLPDGRRQFIDLVCEVTQ